MLLRDHATTVGMERAAHHHHLLIRGGGARVNDERFRNETGTVRPEDFTAEGTLKLWRSAGV